MTITPPTTENEAPILGTEPKTFSDFLKTLGPGIMAASAAIGGSHLVSSTQAGALYGWALALFIILINFLKYPFFRAGVAYTMAAGEDLVQGYARLGKGYVWLVYILDIFGGIVSTAAVCVFSAALLNYFSPIKIPMPWASAGVMLVSFLVLILGRYQMLARLSKWIVALLAVATVVAVLVAATKGSVAPADYVAPSPWTLASLGFLVMLMGWMPSPLDVTALTSVWVVSQKKHIRINKKSVLFDFNLGFIVTAFLAVVFLALGALVMNGAPEKLAMSGSAFTNQLINMYASTIGEWSKLFIAFIAFCCIWGTTITVMDGYARVVAICQLHLLGRNRDDYRATMNFWMAAEALLGLLLLLYFQSEMLVMLKFAMISAFFTTPLLAILNYKLMTSDYIPPQERFGPILRLWSWAGFLFLFGFLGLFIWWQWFMPR